MVTDITHVGENSHTEQERGFEFGFVMVVGKNWTLVPAIPFRTYGRRSKGLLWSKKQLNSHFSSGFKGLLPLYIAQQKDLVRKHSWDCREKDVHQIK